MLQLSRFALLFIAPSMLASETPVDLFSLDLEELSQIRVQTATRREQPLSDIPARIEVFDATALRRRGFRHLGELLASLPGVDLQHYSSVTFYNRFSVRGLSGNNKILVLQAGVRIGPPAGEPATLHYNLPLHHLRQVEVVFGPASAVYGADAMTAVVNLVTARPENTTVELAAGEWNSRRGNVSTGGKHGDWRWQLAGQFQRTDGADLPDAYPEQFPWRDLRNFGGTVVVPLAARQPNNNQQDSQVLSAGLQMPAGFEAGWHSTRYTTPTTAGDRPDSANYGSEWQVQQDTLFLRQRSEFNNGWQLTTLLDYSRYEVEPESAFNNIFSAFAKAYKYADSERRELDLQLGLPLTEHDYLTTGLNLERLNALPKTADLSAPYDTGRSTVEQGLFYTGTNNSLPIQIFKTEQQQRGGFVQWQRDWSASWHSLIGVRIDDSDSWANEITPRLGVQYRVGESWRAHLSYSEAYLAPSPQFVYEHFGAFTGVQDGQGRYIASFFQVPNPALEAENLDTVELGWHWQINRHAALTASLYSSRLENYVGLVPMATPDNDFVPGGVILASQQWANVGDADLLGAEFGGQWQWRQTDQQWQLDAALSWTDGTLNRAGIEEPLPYVADYKLHAALSWQHDNGAFANLNLIASRPVKVLDNPTLPEDETVPGFAVANLLLGWQQLLGNATLQLRVDNLTDARYYHAGTGTRTTFVASPQDPRQFFLELRLLF